MRQVALIAIMAQVCKSTCMILCFELCSMSHVPKLSPTSLAEDCHHCRLAALCRQSRRGCTSLTAYSRAWAPLTPSLKASACAFSLCQ